MIALTLDIDWAPDWMIEKVAEMLLKYGVKATWFATHRNKFSFKRVELSLMQRENLLLYGRRKI